VAIPDADPAGASVPLRVSGVGPVSRVTFSIDGTDCAAAAGLQHPFVSDLVGTLTGPDGTQATLFSRVGGSGDNYCRVVFDDAGVKSITTATGDDPPFTGTWQPAQPLSAFFGKPGDGAWRFTVTDVASGDLGVVHAVSVHVSGFQPPPG
jgi:subtilisin-like proprotein convertase family protein